MCIKHRGWLQILVAIIARDKIELGFYNEGTGNLFIGIAHIQGDRWYIECADSIKIYSFRNSLASISTICSYRKNNLPLI